MIARFTVMVTTSRTGSRCLLLATLVLTSISLAGIPVSALAQADDKDAQDRLNRLGTQLLSGSAPADQAIAELKKILAADPRSAQAHLLLGIAYRMSGSPDFMGEAAAEMRQALALEPNFVPARFYLARLYLDLGRAGRAREELQAGLAQQPGHPQLLALLGETERQLKNPSRAVQLNREALAADPSFAEARYYLGLALLDLGDRSAGIRELEQVMQSGARQVELFLSLGVAYIEAGRFEDAVTVLGEGIQLDAGRPELRIQLSRAYRSMGLLEKAQAQLKIATPGAIQALASGFQQQEVEFEFHKEQGLLAMAQGRLAAAVESLQKVLTMDPDHGPTNRDLAEAYLRQGSYTLASQYAARADKLGYPLAPARRGLLEQRLKAQGAGKTR